MAELTMDEILWIIASSPACNVMIEETDHFSEDERKRFGPDISRVRERGGRVLRCIPDSLRGDKLEFECAGGHVITMKTATILRRCAEENLICHRCAHKGVLNPLGLETGKSIAEARGGKLLSDSYAGVMAPYRWQCALGHEWDALYNNVIAHGSWCPVCSAFGVCEETARACFKTLFPDHMFPKDRPGWLDGLELDGYEDSLKLAFEYDGIQHFEFTPAFHKTSEDFDGQVARDRKKDLLCSEEGVILIRIPHTVKQEEMFLWIKGKLDELGISPHVVGGAGRTSQMITSKAREYLIDSTGKRGEMRHAQLEEIARSKGGTLITEGYLGWNVKHEFVCSEGHAFASTADSIVSGKFCAKCGGRKRIEDDEVVESMRLIGVRVVKAWQELGAGGRHRKKIAAVWPCCAGVQESFWDNVKPKSDNPFVSKRGCPRCRLVLKGKRVKDQAVGSLTPEDESKYYKTNESCLWLCIKNQSHPKVRSCRRKLRDFHKNTGWSCVACELEVHEKERNVAGTPPKDGSEFDGRIKLDWMCLTCGRKWKAQMAYELHKRACKTCG